MALSTSYRHGEFSSVYSVARGLGVALTPLLAWALFAEQLSPLGVAGILIVVLGIVVAARRAGAAGHGGSRRAVGWALLTGLTIASYSILDSSGARRMHPVPFLCGTSIGAVLLCAPLVLRQRSVLREEWRRNVRTILLASTMNLSGYLLVLWAYRSSKTGYVTAARELSIALSPLVGRVVLGEKALGARLVGAVIILAGVVCVALAR
ncbi:MAG: DMT family transporter [Polyangiaceae bacterium]